MTTTENRTSAIDHELLALFDDKHALSQLENSNLGTSFVDLSFYGALSRPIMIDESWDWILDYLQRDDKVYRKSVVGDKTKHVFAMPKIYNCMYCAKRFYNKLACRNHQIEHVKRQLQCAYCGRRMPTTSALRRHFEYFHHCPRQHVLIETSY